MLGTTVGEASVIISDEGAGMDDDVIKYIFDKFYQGDKSKATAGTGLGLSPAKRILEFGNGKIEVVSGLGKGTAFTVSLPIG